MIIFFQDCVPTEVDIEPEDLWTMYRAVRAGTADVRIMIPFRGNKKIPISLEYLDGDRTFTDAIVSNFISRAPDTLPAPVSFSGAPDSDKDPRY